MKLAEDYRYEAREALRGQWWTAILTSFLAWLIGAFLIGSGGVDIELTEEMQVSVRQLSPTAYRAVVGFLVACLIHILVIFIIGGAGKLGNARFQLNLVDGLPASPRDLFSNFHRLRTGFFMNLLIALYTALWSMLFIIPGIVKSYSYAMTPYILTENRWFSANDAIDESRRIMDGNRWRLFCLRWSFLGWDLLCAIPDLVGLILFMTGVIDVLWYLMLVLAGLPAFWVLQAYREAAQAAFYRDITAVWNENMEPTSGDSASPNE